MIPILRHRLAIDYGWLIPRLAIVGTRYVRHIPLSPQRSQVVSEKGIAIIPVHGVLSQRQSEMMDWFGGTATESVAAAVVAAVNNQSINAVVLDVDSPGGMTYGIEETAGIIRTAAKMKPVFAIVNSRAMSAAYWLASAVGQGNLFAAPGSDVGSIGVFMLHEDISGMLEVAGIKVTCIHAGESKAELLSCMALSDEAKAHLQSQVDITHAAFVRDVAVGRGVSEAAVRASFGGGRFFDASVAANIGMVDGVRTMRDLMAEVGKKHDDDMDDDEDMMMAQNEMRIAWKRAKTSGFNLFLAPAQQFCESVRERMRRLDLTTIN